MMYVCFISYFRDFYRNKVHALKGKKWLKSMKWKRLEDVIDNLQKSAFKTSSGPKFYDKDVA